MTENASFLSIAPTTTTLDESIVSTVPTVTDKNDSDFNPDDLLLSDEEVHDDEWKDLDGDHRERYLLVCESKLRALFIRCPKCDGKNVVTREIESPGSLFAFEIVCLKGCTTTWKSQPTLKCNVGVGNINVVSAVTLAGIPESKFQRFVWLVKWAHSSTFYRNRKWYVRPAIRDMCVNEHVNVIDEIKNKDTVVLIGDGRSDSPGHSAKYGTCTFMDSNTGKVVDTAVIAVNLVS